MEIKDGRTTGEIEEQVMNQKKIRLINSAVEQIRAISKKGEKPDTKAILQQVYDFDEFVYRFWGMEWNNESLTYSKRS